jgi:hypothetical protein
MTVRREDPTEGQADLAVNRLGPDNESGGGEQPLL